MRSPERKKRRHRSRSKDRSRDREKRSERRRSRSREPQRSRSREKYSKKREHSEERSTRRRSRSPLQSREKSRHRTQKSEKVKRSRSRSRERTESSPYSRSRSRSRERQRRRSHSPVRRKPTSEASSSGRRRSRSPPRRTSPSISGESSSEATGSSSESSSSEDEKLSKKEKKKLMKKRAEEKRKLREDRVRAKEERRYKKELMKSIETPEEKRARRLAKKAAKERKQKERMGWDREMMGYTNADNPFGDPNLLETFVWDKKNAKVGLSHLEKEELKRISRQKQIENRLELTKVKQRRLEREREKEEREREMEFLQRQKESEQFKEWETEEDSFHLHQAKMRSKIRIQDARAKPIDLLAQYIGAEEEDDLAVEMHEPYKVLNGLTIVDLEDLLEDIKVYIALEQGQNVGFWKDMTIITEDELVKLKKIEPKPTDGVERREGINASVSNEVASVFKAKTSGQLLALKDQILQKIQSGSAVDIGYWESLLQQLKAHMARARLRERHQERLRNKLLRLRQQQGVAPEPLFPAGAPDDDNEQSFEKDGAAVKESGEIQISDDDDEEEAEEMAGDDNEGTKNVGDDGAVASGSKDQNEEAEAKGKEDESVLTEQDLLKQSQDEYELGKFSPRLLTNKDLPPDTLLFDVEEDMIRLEHARRQVLGTGTAKDSAEAEFEKKAREGMGRDEATFAVEVPSGKLYLWSDKYRPRKPRYFNRVHTGFEWNKYNQTHYDMDNPPPKIVQGYKFNIFYPDLIDKRNTPEYILTPCDDNKDFALLKFNAGPPYEDIAFKIVNREWEYSHRHGFRCQYSNGIFQLWFHFKRYRYRR